MRLEFQSPGACNSAFFSTRCVLPGQAAGRVGPVRFNSLKIWKIKLRLPNLLLRLLGMLTSQARAATSGQDEPLYSHVLAAFSRWLSPKSRRAPLSNSPKRTLSQRTYRLLIQLRQKSLSSLFKCFEVLPLRVIHADHHNERTEQGVVIP